MSISEGEFRNLEPEPTFGTRSHPKLEGVNQYVDYPGKNTVIFLCKRKVESQNSPDNDHDIVYNYESTGRFGGHFVPYGYEFNDDDIESYNKDNENRSLNNERPQFERKSSGTSSKRVKELIK